MTGPAWCFLGLAVAMLALYLIACYERDRIADQRDRLAKDLRMVRRQRDLTEAERADLDAVLRHLLAERPPAAVLPLRRIPGQRNGEGA